MLLSITISFFDVNSIRRNLLLIMIILLFDSLRLAYFHRY